MSPPNRAARAIFDAAVQLPPQERAACLEAACGADQHLRRRVEALLHAHDESGTFMEGAAAPRPPAASPDPAAPISSGPAASETPGQTIGRYKLLEKLGEGGCGVVYAAEQAEPVRRRVALKVIRLGMDTKSVIARFEAERQALAMMDHPNIAKVFDGGVTETGRSYFVMELVRGIPITHYCDEASLTTRGRLELFIQVCQAVQHAHQKGIIHRDIKPSNILVTLHDGVPVPKVIDFGIAKAIEGRLTDHTVYTELRQFMGTPAYMSPEQAEMSGLDIDTRSDIYSLGVLLYELLAGSTPFDARELMAAGLDAMRKIIREQEPLRPSTAFATLGDGDSTTRARCRSTEPAKLRHQLQGDLDWIVMKCLEKDRRRRYETANGLALDLRRHLTDEPVLARPPGRLYQFQKAFRRHRFMFVAAGAVGAALVLGLAATTWQTLRALRAEASSKQKETRAVKAENAARDRLAEVAKERDAKELARQDAEAISQFLSDVFQSPDPARDGRTITVAETLDQAAKKLEEDRAIPPARRASLQEALGRTYFALGLYREALPLHEKVRDYYQATAGSEDRHTLGAMQNLALSYFHTSHLEAALKLREQTLPLSRKVNGPEHPDTLLAMSNLADSYADLGRRDDALKLREEVRALSRKVKGNEHPTTLLAMNDLANSYNDVGRLGEALKLREEVLALCRKASGPEPVFLLNLMQNLATSYAGAGRRDEALKLREELLPRRRKVNGPQHPTTLLAMSGLAASYEDAGRRDEALKLREEMLNLYRKAKDPEDPELLEAAARLSISYAEAGRREEAQRLQAEVLPLLRKATGLEYLHTRNALHYLANSYIVLGRRDEALSLREEVLALCRKVKGLEHPDTLKAMSNLANSYADTGRRDEALKLQEEALPLFQKLFGSEHPNTLAAMINLATSYFDLHRPGEALKLQEEALPLARKVLGPEHPNTLMAMRNLAIYYSTAGRTEEALKLNEELLAPYRKSLGSTHPQTVETLNFLAWSLATNPNAQVRNGAKAVQFAAEAVAATSRKNPDYLDSLAAAYAEAGQFDKAVTVEREAIAVYQTEAQKQEAGSHLKLYLANQPYHEPANR